MIDTHAHVLHKVDDGPATIEEAAELVRLAYRQGITRIVATPHFKFPYYVNKGIEQSYAELQRVLQANSIDVTIRLGNEIYLGEEEIRAVDHKAAYTLAESNYLLVELPRSGIFHAHERMIYELQLKKYRIILAHVERYDYLLNGYKLLGRLVSQGCSAQLTASALLTGGRERKKAYELINKGLVHLVATDCHNSGDRAPRLLEAYERVTVSFGAQAARDLFNDNALAILEDESAQAVRKKL